MSAYFGHHVSHESHFEYPAVAPTGEELAGWWRRVFALIIDVVILAVVTIVVCLPLLQDDFEAAFAPGASGIEVSASDSVMVGFIGWALSFCYFVGFWTLHQATPGKFLLGLRVRFADPDRRFGAAVKRWLLHSVSGSMPKILPGVALLSNVFWCVNMLWPLWDREHRALHDKFADTHVVRVR